MFRVRIVFDVEVGHQIHDLGVPKAFTLDGIGQGFEIVELSPGSEYSAQRITLKSPSFETSDEAIRCAERVEGLLMSVSADRGFAMSFTPQRPEPQATAHALEQFARAHGGRVLQENLGSTVYDDRIPTRFASATPFILKTGTPSAPYIEHLQNHSHRSALTARRARVAFDLWGSSRSERSSMARLLLLTAAVEAVADNPLRSDQELAFLDSAVALLNANTVGLDSAQRNRFKSLLGSLRHIGSRAACRLALKSSSGQVGVEVFDRAYDLRNQVTHGKHSPNADVLVDAANELEHCVRKLLLDILLAA